ncbi:MAG: enhanced serine sensitivity protein SseB C-terminal domain-containing protein [Cellvibrionaceae bacterium]
MNQAEENQLERLLRLASTEPAHRPEFCSVLMSSTIYILGNTGTIPDKPGEVELTAGSSINIVNWEKPDGSPVIPFFTSIEVLQKSIDSEQSYLAIPTSSLFEMTLGAVLFLNPKSDHGKEFIPDEIEHLLSVGLSQPSNQRVVEEDTHVLLGQPSDIPSKMIDSLTQLFAKHKIVKNAYLALMHDQSIDDKPHLIVGIEFIENEEAKVVEVFNDQQLELIMREAGNVAADSAPKGESVDLCVVSKGEEGISQYFINQTKPFYEKSWGDKLSASPQENHTKN